LAYNTVPLLPALFIAGLLAMVVALLISILIMRLNGLAAGIATFAFLIIANVVYSNWQSMTRGTSSIVGIPVYVTTEVAMIWAAIAILVANIYQTTRYGTMLRATRDDNVAAASSGIDVRRQRTISFVISAFLSGIGGALYAHYLGAVSVDAFYLELTFMTLAMLVVGGSGSLTGAVMGVVIISTVRELLRSLEGGLNVPGATIQLPLGTQEICVGLAMLLIIMFRPQGLFGNSEIRAPNWLSSRLVRHQLAA
jgi:branched-chain amino acid transport system permease protein